MFPWEMFSDAVNPSGPVLCGFVVKLTRAVSESSIFLVVNRTTVACRVLHVHTLRNIALLT